MSGSFQRPKWAPRISRFEIARLYHADAKGMRDEDLVNDVGYGLFARIKDILTVTEAAKGRVACPEYGATIIRKRPKLRKDAKKEMLTCGSCHWNLPWREYFKSYHKKHLLCGGMGPFFREFVKQWPRAKGYGEKIVVIDTLIHRFHWELEGDPGGPGAVNLIGGTRNEIIAFLNELTYGSGSTATLAENRERWRKVIGGDQVDRRSQAHRWEGHDRLNEEQEEDSQPSHAPDAEDRAADT